MAEVLGTIVIALNGDRTEYYQDPDTYVGSLTHSTPLGAAQSHMLGATLRSTYLEPSAPSHIKGISSKVVDPKQIHVRVKGGYAGEGPVIFDSALALLQGLYPPDPSNKITLANDTTVVAPLGGYQYVPVETVEPTNDRSIESWTDCPAFQKHVKQFYSSGEFKDMEKEAEPFFKAVKDFVFGRPTNLKNIWNIYDYMSTELVHNKTYAYRLPPSLTEQARALANWKENGVFSDSPSGIGNIAGRTLLHTILESLERISFDDDPLQFLLVETAYPSFISLFHETQMIANNPELASIPDYASALVIELRKSGPPDIRNFLRFKFKNGTGDFTTVKVFGHNADIPLTEFIYRAEGSAVSPKQWSSVCGASFIPHSTYVGNTGSFPTYGLPSAVESVSSIIAGMSFIAAFFVVGMLAWMGVNGMVKGLKKRRDRKRNLDNMMTGRGEVRLDGPETQALYGATGVAYPREKIVIV